MNTVPTDETKSIISFKTDKKYRTTDKQAISLDVGNFHNKSDRVANESRSFHTHGCR